MNSQKSQQITARFFIAIGRLMETGAIASQEDFCRKWEIDPLLLIDLQKQKACDLNLLSIMVECYFINAFWLLTGRGSIWDNNSPAFRKIKHLPAIDHICYN